MPAVSPHASRPDPSMLGNSGFERRERDFYATPPEVTEALCRVLLRERILGPTTHVWEPACGDGAMVTVLKKHFRAVIATDIEPQMAEGYIADFLTTTPRDIAFNAIITNPPFGDMVDKFIARGLQHVRQRGCTLALLGKQELDSASGRFPFFGGCPEFAAKISLLWRPRWIAGTTGSPRHNYAWYVWQPKFNVVTANGPKILYAYK